jgi:biopolymer transport protein TolR
MAFSGMGWNGSGGRGRRRSGGASLSEMNVVPLVDVVLVLLIIFMITASAMEFGLEVEVPTVKSSETSVKELPIVAIDRSGKTYVNDKATNINLLASEIRSRFRGMDEVYVRSDKSITWDVLSQVVSALGDAKFKVKLVTKGENIPARK